jgi:TatD DNase family protein
MMKYPDIHTHRRRGDAYPAILNTQEEATDETISVGIHPWYVDNGWKEEFHTIEELAKAQNVVAIGECGIDKVRSAAIPEIQEEAFRAHIALSESLQKPLIIHCVKAYDTIIALHKETKPRQAWIIHAFRGKPQQAAQLTKAGLHLSLGEHFNEESARSIPADRLFIESDDSNTDIEDIYRRAATAKGCTVAELVAAVIHNAQICNLL